MRDGDRHLGFSIHKAPHRCGCAPHNMEQSQKKIASDVRDESV